jgi:hypothetical protein
MKKIVTTAAIMFCVMNVNAQTRNYIKKDTIEILMYDSLGNEYHTKPPRYIIKRTEMGDPAYWKKKHKRDRTWDRIGLGIFSVATVIGFVVVGSR